MKINVCLVCRRIFETVLVVGAHTMHTQAVEQHDDDVKHIMLCLVTWLVALNGLVRGHMMWSDELVVDIPL